MMIFLAAETYSSVINSLGPILVIAGMVAVVFAFFKTQVTAKTIDNLKEYAESLAEDRDETKRRLAELELTCGQLKKENESLRSYVSGTEAVEELSKEIREWTSELTGHVMAIEAMLSSAIKTVPPRKPRTARKTTSTTRRTK